jgi:hypothetical protein
VWVELFGNSLSCLQVDGDVTTLKLIVLFEADLQAAATTGLLSPELHGVLTEAFDNLSTDSQEVESVNSILSRIVTLSPAIQKELLSSRLMIKKHLGYTTASCKSKAEDLWVQPGGGDRAKCFWVTDFGALSWACRSRSSESQSRQSLLVAPFLTGESSERFHRCFCSAWASLFESTSARHRCRASPA